MTTPMVVDLARLQTRLGYLLSYMEECRVFKPLDTIANPLGLCRFYQADPLKSNVIMSLKSAASTHRIKCLLELAKEIGQPLTIMVFEGGTVTPLGLLQELHSRLTLSCIPIHTSEKVKMGQKNRVSCCPICACMSSKMTTHSSITSSSATTGAVFPVVNAWSLWHPPGSK